MKMFVSAGGKDCGGALLLDYPPEKPPAAIRHNGKVYSACTELRNGAVLYIPNDSVVPDESIEVVEIDGCIGKSALARVQKVDECDDWGDPRR